MDHITIVITNRRNLFFRIEDNKEKRHTQVKLNPVFNSPFQHYKLHNYFYEIIIEL
jgi:hypothetical protein